MRHSHLGCQDTCRQIAHISRGDAELNGLAQQIGGPSVVNALRHPTRDVDAVGRGQRALDLQFTVQKRRLDHRLTIVERTLHFERFDVGSCCGQLLLLNLADSALGIQNDHINVGHIQKSLGHCTSRIPARGDQNGQPTVTHTTQHPRKEPRANILEGMGRPMKKLQRIDIVLNFMQRQRKIQYFLKNVQQFLMAQHTLGIWSHHRRTQIPRVQIFIRQPKFTRERWDVFGKIQTLVRGKTFHNGLPKIPLEIRIR